MGLKSNTVDSPQALANGNAWTAVNFARNTSDLIDAIKSGEINPTTAALPKVTMLSGGLIIEAGGSLLGSVGVAGAQGSARDEACVRAGIAAARDKLDF
ncbi:MAG: heme-binding protein [Pseudolabrys sp.]